MFRIMVEISLFGLLSIPFLSAQERVEASSSVDVKALHYWEHFDFKNVSLTPLDENMETFIVNYLKLLNVLPVDRAASLIQDMMHTAVVDSTCFARLIEVYEELLTNRASPVCNEELMKAVLKIALKESVLGDIDKIRPTMLLELLSKNSVGMKAADFYCTFQDGSSKKMTDISADFLLLFFYDPECDHCESVISLLSASKEVDKYLKNGKLKILAVYPDEDISAWESFASSFPDNWLNVYDASLAIRENELYDLMETPTIYLLDKEHKVIRKNILPEKVISILLEEIN